MVEVRAATKSDAAAIRRINEAAFPTPVEADLVEGLERDGDSSISLIAADHHQIVGHILFSRMTVEADGRRLNALALAPVAVLPERQSLGIGSALIRAGLARARDVGTDIVFVLGEPRYYGRFGFTAAAASAFASPYAGPYFHALALTDRDATPSTGRADYAPAFAGLE